MFDLDALEIKKRGRAIRNERLAIRKLESHAWEEHEIAKTGPFELPAERIKRRLFSKIKGKTMTHTPPSLTAELLAALTDARSRLEDWIGSDCECDNTHESNRTSCCLCEYNTIITKALEKIQYQKATGTEGQNRESYSDTQDRESYSNE